MILAATFASCVDAYYDTFLFVPLHIQASLPLTSQQLRAYLCALFYLPVSVRSGAAVRSRSTCLVVFGYCMPTL